jgi:hypothetical protein
VDFKGSNGSIDETFGAGLLPSEYYKHLVAVGNTIHLLGKKNDTLEVGATLKTLHSLSCTKKTTISDSLESDSYRYLQKKQKALIISSYLRPQWGWSLRNCHNRQVVPVKISN